MKVKCDSTVVKTDVHYPTDINLLFDAIRKVITLVGYLCNEKNISGWRQYKNNIKTFKKFYRKIQKLKKSKSKQKKTQKKRENEIIRAVNNYIANANIFLERAEESIKHIPQVDIVDVMRVDEITKFICHAYRQIDQIVRRMINGETIPHNEKVFSIFEEHTEWISKGKAGVPQELGINVCIIEDQYGFILHHKVMQKQSDKDIAVKIIEEIKERFDNLASCSFDKGFHSPENRKNLEELLNMVILPKKGKLSFEDKKREYDEKFIQEKNNHSAVESSISALKNHGLDRCLDHGICGFNRYVALAVVARNIQILGNYFQQVELNKLIKQNKSKDTRKLKKAS